MTESVERRRDDVDPDALDRLLRLVDGRGAKAQLCVMRDGEVLVDHAVGCAPDALFWTFSVSKPFVALLVHLLVERGVLDLDQRVAAYWPGYGRDGKGPITVRHVLTHRAGVPYAGTSLVSDVWTMTDWDRAVAAAERARPRWPAGQVPAYHVLTYGFILGELVRRVSGTPVAELLRRELLDPLGLHDLGLGLSDALWPRHVPLQAAGARGLGRRFVFNRRTTRQAVIPAAGVSATAHDLARFYQMLLHRGELDGVRVLAPATIEQALRVSSDGEMDRVIKRPVRWGHGFQLGGPAGTVRPMGRYGSAHTFGHNGSGICNVWADPVRGLVFAYVTNLVASRRDGLDHQCRVSDAVLTACG